MAEKLHRDMRILVETESGHRIPATIVEVDVNGNSPKKIRPQGKTVDVINLIRRGKPNEQINMATGKSVQNVRTIRSRLKKGLYEV